MAGEKCGSQKWHRKDLSAVPWHLWYLRPCHQQPFPQLVDASQNVPPKTVRSLLPLFGRAASACVVSAGDGRRDALMDWIQNNRIAPHNNGNENYVGTKMSQFKMY